MSIERILEIYQSDLNYFFKRETNGDEINRKEQIYQNRLQKLRDSKKNLKNQYYQLKRQLSNSKEEDYLNQIKGRIKTTKLKINDIDKKIELTVELLKRLRRMR